MRKTPPHIAFIDLLMPVMGGEQVLRAMGNDERLIYVPVVLVGARNVAEGHLDVEGAISITWTKPRRFSDEARRLWALLQAAHPGYLR